MFRISTVVLTCLATVPMLMAGDNGAPGQEETLRVAVVSSHSVFADVDRNLEHFTGLIEEAAAQGARLVCFPELALVSYSTHPKALEAAEEIPGPITWKLETVTRRLGVYVSVGMAERDGEKTYISQIVVGPEGYLGKYRKHHPTGGEQKKGFSPGESFPVWNIDGFRFGVLICYDGRSADTIEAMKKAEVDIIHHPHGNGVGNLGRDAEEWTRSKMVYFVDRAAYARAYILVNNSAEDTVYPDGNFRYSSGAMVLDPLGQVVTRTMQEDRQEKMVFATLKKPVTLIPHGELEVLKREDPVFKERFGSN